MSKPPHRRWTLLPGRAGRRLLLRDKPMNKKKNIITFAAFLILMVGSFLKTGIFYVKFIIKFEFSDVSNFRKFS